MIKVERELNEYAFLDWLNPLVAAKDSLSNIDDDVEEEVCLTKEVDASRDESRDENDAEISEKSDNDDSSGNSDSENEELKPRKRMQWIHQLHKKQSFPQHLKSHHKSLPLIFQSGNRK